MCGWSDSRVQFLWLGALTMGSGQFALHLRQWLLLPDAPPPCCCSADELNCGNGLSAWRRVAPRHH